MKLTTDYDRVKNRAIKKEPLKEECICRKLAASVIENNGNLTISPNQAAKLHKKFIKIFDNMQYCQHEILYAIIINMDRQNSNLQTLHNADLPLINLGEKNETILHLATKRQSLNCIQEILQIYHGKTVKLILAKDKNGVTALHLAAMHHSEKILKLLLSELGQIRDLFGEARDENGQSPLHYAAAAGSLACCETLLLGEFWQLPLDQRDRYGQTPLMYAVGCKYAKQVVRLLATKKTIAITIRNKRGMTALHLAVLNNNLDALKIFFEELHTNPSVFDNEQRTPLHYAALFGRVEATRLLLNSGACNETRDQDNLTPVHYAAQNGDFDTLNSILTHQDKIQINEILDNEGRTCFMWAIIAQHEELVGKMLSEYRISKTNDDIADINGHKAIHLAALIGHVGICKLLVEDGFSISEGDARFDATPEHLAAGQGHLEALDYFIYKRVKPGQILLDNQQRTPLFYACLGGQAHVVEKLKKNDKNHVDLNGFTAIHCAVQAGSLACVKILIRCGFDANIKDKNNQTALDLAKVNQKKNINCQPIIDYLTNLISTQNYSESQE